MQTLHAIQWLDGMEVEIAMVNRLVSCEEIIIAVSSVSMASIKVRSHQYALSDLTATCQNEAAERLVIQIGNQMLLIEKGQQLREYTSRVVDLMFT